MFRLVDITRGKLIVVISAKSMRSAQLYAAKRYYGRFHVVYPAGKTTIQESC